MSDFLKDKNLQFLTIQENDLKSISSDIESILQTSLKDDSSLSIKYLIRYDGIGIIRNQFNEIVRCFNIGKHIERINFKLQNKNSHLSSGKNIEIMLDAYNGNNCLLVVSDDDEAWVVKNFQLLSSRLDNFKNKNKIVHFQITELFIQLLGVLSGLFISLIIAKLLSSKISIQYPFFVVFICIFLIFSNLWTFIIDNIYRLRLKFWPFISFKKKPLGIVWQSIIGLLISSIVVYLGKQSLNILKNVTESIIK